MNVRHLLLSAVFSLLGCNPVVGGQCADGYEACGGACVPSGTCDAVLPKCPSAGPAAAPADAGIEVSTSTLCADVTADPMNCGACGNVCATGVCTDGVCHGNRVGDVIVIGHDFVGAAPMLAMSNALANAVFMRSKSPVRVLSWQQHADPAAIGGVFTVLDAESLRSGRRYTRAIAETPEDMRVRISATDFDVVLIFDQSNAAPGDLASDGATLADPLQKFGEEGGVVIVLDGGRGTGEMPRFLASARIADVALQSDASGALLDVVAPSDVVGSGVMAPYKAPSGTVSLILGGSLGAFATVVSEPITGRPVVLHRIVRSK